MKANELPKNDQDYYQLVYVHKSILNIPRAIAGVSSPFQFKRQSNLLYQMDTWKYK